MHTKRKQNWKYYYPVSDPEHIAPSLASCFAEHGGPWADYAPIIADLQIPQGFSLVLLTIYSAIRALFHIIDWKSNDLSHKEAINLPLYGAKCCIIIMSYNTTFIMSLCSVFYNNALSYDYERHVGAAHYVFVRGLDGAGSGWYHHRPSAAMINALDACFERCMSNSESTTQYPFALFSAPYLG